MLFDERFLYRYMYHTKGAKHVGNGIYKKCDQLMEADANMILRFFTQTIILFIDITVVVVVNLRPNIYTLEKS